MSAFGGCSAFGAVLACAGNTVKGPRFVATDWSASAGRLLVGWLRHYSGATDLGLSGATLRRGDGHGHGRVRHTDIAHVVAYLDW